MRVGPAQRTLLVVSHLAVWPGVYVAGAAACAVQLTGGGLGGGHGARLLCFVFVTAVAAYLLDRVKLRNAWQEPADAASVPARHRFMARHGRGVRVLVALLWAAGTITGFVIWPLLSVAPTCGLVGVAVYAGLPRGWATRPKDVFGLKNLYVAAGITGFAHLAALLSAVPDFDLLGSITAERLIVFAFAGAVVFARVLIDAALCDLDDEEADRRFGTGTLPVRVGGIRARRWALVGRGVLGALVMAALPLPLAARVAWGGLTILGTAAVWLSSPRRVRDVVDGQLGVEALIVWLVLFAV